MASAHTPPIISVSYSFDDDQHVIMATSHNRSAEAGERIFRSEPWPNIKFKHATEEAALRDAAILRQYLDECYSGKRKGGETKIRGRGWWEDDSVPSGEDDF